ncbi:cell division cycle protein 23 homolog [Bacillus rossius redtenbacheri]|uniref:cell division cycle protein 23 homolog n=1 Tax=Bacillus rossius redtenbacheri TaxID=93214 RepID=UPI002FDF06BE
MTEDYFKYDLKDVKVDIKRAIFECSQRGLYHSTKWLAELNYSLSSVELEPADIARCQQPLETDNEADSYSLAQSYFNLKEYDRCAYFTESCVSQRARFLHRYARYLSAEKKRVEGRADAASPPDPAARAELRALSSELRGDRAAGTLDGFGLYLHGVVLKRLDLPGEACDALVEAACREPAHWGAWLELTSLVTDRAKLNSLTLPNTWVKHFFMAHTYLDLQLNDEALEIYWHLQNKGFKKSTYVLAQIAIAYHNKREVELAISSFSRLQKLDPYRLDNLDTYSNLLYVRELRLELAHLAHHVSQIDKYRVETCCVIGNYYSLRTEHQKAVLYFQRALKLNPQYTSAWTLMGHEYMEMKNTNAAILSYRQAIEVSRRDYRAWYGLGQTYEILKMYFYCLYYYKQAQFLRPNDSRMLIALGETYEKLEKKEDAIKCYYKAYSVGDSELTSTLKLAKLYDKLEESSNAKRAYLKYVTESEKNAIADKSELSQAYKYLANAYLKTEDLDEAYQFAQKCLEYEETKEEGKALLKAIAQKRNQQEEIAMQVEEYLSSSRMRTRAHDGTSGNQIAPINLSFM